MGITTEKTEDIKKKTIVIKNATLDDAYTPQEDEGKERFFVQE